MMVEFEEVFRLGSIKRWHMVPCTREQTVGEHTFNVMLLVTEMTKHFDTGPITAAAFLRAFTHDFDECIFGDMAPPAKREFGIKEEPTSVIGWPRQFESFDINESDNELSMLIVKAADQAEALRFLVEYGTGEYAKKVKSSQTKRLVQTMSDIQRYLPKVDYSPVRDTIRKFVNTPGHPII